MKIPNFLDEKLIDEKGHMADSWKHMFSQLFHELQTKMSDEGHVIPEQPTSNIILLNDAKYKGGLLYDTDTDKAKVNIAGIYKEIVTA